jgi:hypothetical protein
MITAPRVLIADPPPQHVWTWPARLVRPVDGDSFWVVTDRGYADTSEREIRLAGINCPEHGTKDGDAASAFTAAWLAEAEKRATTPWPLLMRSCRARRPVRSVMPPVLLIGQPSARQFAAQRGE